MNHKQNLDAWLREQLDNPANAVTPDPEPFWQDFQARFGQPSATPQVHAPKAPWLFSLNTWGGLLLGLGVVAALWFALCKNEAAGASASSVCGEAQSAPDFAFSVQKPVNQFSKKSGAKQKPALASANGASSDFENPVSTSAQTEREASAAFDPAEFHDPEIGASAKPKPCAKSDNFVVAARNWSEDSRWQHPHESTGDLRWSDEQEWSEIRKWAERFARKKDSVQAKTPPIHDDL